MSDLFNFASQKKLFAVFGNPISHSKSPLVHQLFAEQFKIHLEYRAVHVEVGGFEQAVSGFQANGGVGLNVTVPFKLKAWKLADELGMEAQMASAVNTLTLGKVIKGDNTDGKGLVHDVEVNLGTSLSNKNILVVGAGGAVCGILGPLLATSPAEIVVANRTKNKAASLVAKFASNGNVRAIGLDETEHRAYDIVFNATSTSLGNQLPDISTAIFDNCELVYDLTYGQKPTRFMVWASQNSDARTSDGLGMLVEQAAQSFNLWHGVMPKTPAVIAAVRKNLG